METVSAHGDKRGNYHLDTPSTNRSVYTDQHSRKPNHPHPCNLVILRSAFLEEPHICSAFFFPALSTIYELSLRETTDKRAERCGVPLSRLTLYVLHSFFGI